jgi:hypothetical protein
VGRAREVPTKPVRTFGAIEDQNEKVVGSIPTGGSDSLYEPGSSLTEWLGFLLYRVSVAA